MRQQFEALRERLLRAGIAPRHVERFVRELEEHYEDVLAEELRRTATRADAERIAWVRLGSEEALAQSVLSKSELRSIAARHPKLVFGALPVSAWLVSLVASVLLLWSIPNALGVSASEPEWALPAAHAACLFGVRVIPVLIGMLTVAAATRQRSRALWPLVGSAIVTTLSGTISVNLIPPAGAMPGQLGLSSSLLPFIAPYTSVLGPIDVGALGFGLLRAALMMSMVVAAHTEMRRRVAQVTR
jgi:hypothetical protein